MSCFLRGACALLLMAAAAGAQPNGGGAELMMFNADDTVSSNVKQTSCNCGLDECGDCGPVCDLGCCPPPCMAGQVFFGAEWLSVRANYSEATAYRHVDLNNDLETFVQIPMEYGSSYRLYGGYRLCDCGAEVRFTYSNFNSDGGGTSTPNLNIIDDGETFYGPFEINLGDGDQLVYGASTNIDNFDLGFSKTIPLGCPLSCGGCGDCGDCCDPCCGPVCAAWDITWTGALRFANVDSDLTWTQIRDPSNTTPSGFANSSVDFDGAGLRFGLAGRRYFGRTGSISAYLRGDISLLLGDVTHTVNSDPAFTDVTITSTEVIPVTEIEAGLTGYLTQNVSVSAGYMLSAWHDLGHRAEYIYASSPTQVYSMDDANMLTLDGFFVRAEAAF